MEEILSLVGDIYDASLDPSLWLSVVESVTRYIDGCAGMLYVQDVASKQGHYLFNWNDNRDYTQSYFEQYIKISPLLPHFMMTQVGEVFTAARLMPHEELRASRFFQEWCVPQDYYDLIGVTLDKTTTSVATFSSGHTSAQGLIGEHTIERLRLLAPHLRRAVLIGKVLELHRSEAVTLATAFDRLGAGIFLVDAAGRTSYANGAGRALTDRGDIVANRHGMLSAVEPQAERTLRASLAAAGAGDGALQTNGIAVPLGVHDGDQYVAHVLSLASGARRAAGLAYDAAAAVFVRKAGLDLPTPIETAAKLYALSPAEIRVLYAVLAEGGVAAMAAMLGLSEATVKTHLQHLFAKTGTSRQLDLVKLVAGFADPLQ